jgi:hypothetical protein
MLSLMEVLDAFAVEPAHDRTTLERYLRDYPQYASPLCQLSFELNRTDLAEAMLKAADEDLVSRAWSRRVSTYGARAVNPLAGLSPAERGSLARDLGIKLQVMSMFREARIALETVPAGFMRRFAERLHTSVDTLLGGLAVPAPATAQAFKADERPATEHGIIFERALRESGAKEDEISALMQDA